MIPYNPDMDGYTDKMFGQKHDLSSEPESFITNLPRYQRPFVVEAVLMGGFPLYIADNATDYSGESLNNCVELHCSDPEFKKSHLPDFWEVFDVLAAAKR